MILDLHPSGPPSPLHADVAMKLSRSRMHRICHEGNDPPLAHSTKNSSIENSSEAAMQNKTRSRLKSSRSADLLDGNNKVVFDAGVITTLSMSLDSSLEGLGSAPIATSSQPHQAKCGP